MLEDNCHPGEMPLNNALHLLAVGASPSVGLIGLKHLMTRQQKSYENKSPLRKLRLINTEQFLKFFFK